MPTTTTTAAAPRDVEDATEETIADRYASIPFDDSRVVKYGEPGWEVLKQVAAPVPQVDSALRTLIDEMGDIMYRAHGVGLAAPQIGKSIRLLVYDAGDGLQALINPVILKMRGEQLEPEEGCLSIPGLRGVVKRASEISVKGLDRNGSPVRLRVSDFEARVIQHEVDHLDGILFIDRADPATLHMIAAEDKDDPPAE